MTQKRVPSIDHSKARGQKLSAGMPDEIDAVSALKLNTPSSTLRAAADGRYRSVFGDSAPGTTHLTVGTGIDDSGDDPVSVTDEAVAALVGSGASATRQVLDSLFSDDDVLGDSDVADLVNDTGSSTRGALVDLIAAEAGGVTGDSDVASIAANPSSATRVVLDSLYSLPAELKSGSPPPAAAHADAGNGAVANVGGTKLAFRVTITTGGNPVQGGCLASFVLSGYSLPPTAFFTACDEITAPLRVWKLASNTELRIMCASELQALTAYTFDVLVVGI